MDGVARDLHQLKQTVNGLAPRQQHCESIVGLTIAVSHSSLVRLEKHARDRAAKAKEENEGPTQAYWNGFRAAVQNILAMEITL